MTKYRGGAEPLDGILVYNVKTDVAERAAAHIIKEWGGSIIPLEDFPEGVREPEARYAIAMPVEAHDEFWMILDNADARPC